jgi:hypothetical protein
MDGARLRPAISLRNLWVGGCQVLARGETYLFLGRRIVGLNQSAWLSGMKVIRCFWEGSAAIRGHWLS